jgi:uncharacterized protein
MSRVRGTTTVAVRVHPKASRARRSWDGHTLSLWVLEPPAGGAANAAVLKAVAQWLGVPRSAIAIRTGQSGRSKLIEITAGVELPPADA